MLKKYVLFIKKLIIVFSNKMKILTKPDFLLKIQELIVNLISSEISIEKIYFSKLINKLLENN